jgi:hypothetical protein
MLWSWWATERGGDVSQKPHVPNEMKGHYYYNKDSGGVEAGFHWFLSLELCDFLHTLTALTPCTYWIKCWEGFKVSLADVEKKEMAIHIIN